MRADNAANAQEIIAGWRDGRPVLESLAEEQEVVADALDGAIEDLDVAQTALREIADVPGRSVTSIIARRALDGKR